jgi:hypothetical protein
MLSIVYDLILSNYLIEVSISTSEKQKLSASYMVHLRVILVKVILNSYCPNSLLMGKNLVLKASVLRSMGEERGTSFLLRVICPSNEY